MALAPWIAPAVLAEYVHNAGIRLRRQFRGHTRHPGRRRRHRPRLHRGLLERPHLHREPRALRHVLDARPVVLGAIAHSARPRASGCTHSLAYALDVWTRRRSHITTTIHYFDRPGDVFEYGVDSLPLFLAAPAGRRCRRPRRAAPPPGSRPRSPISTRWSSTRRPGSSGPIASSAPTATPSSTARTPTATRWSRCWPRRSRRPAGSPRRSSAISRATTAGC